MEDSLSNLSNDINSLDDLVHYYRHAIKIRESNKDKSEEIARFVFTSTHPSQLQIDIPEDLSRVRDEFGALEAPGLPDSTTIDLDTYRDSLWSRLESIINKKWTV